MNTAYFMATRLCTLTKNSLLQKIGTVSSNAQKTTLSLRLRRWLMGRGVLCGQIHTDTRKTKRHNAVKPNLRKPAERILSPPNDMELPMSFEPSPPATVSATRSKVLKNTLVGPYSYSGWTLPQITSCYPQKRK